MIVAFQLKIRLLPPWPHDLLSSSLRRLVIIVVVITSSIRVVIAEKMSSVVFLAGSAFTMVVTSWFLHGGFRWCHHSALSLLTSRLASSSRPSLRGWVAYHLLTAVFLGFSEINREDHLEVVYSSFTLSWHAQGHLENHWHQVFQPPRDRLLRVMSLIIQASKLFSWSARFGTKISECFAAL